MLLEQLEYHQQSEMKHCDEWENWQDYSNYAHQAKENSVLGQIDFSDIISHISKITADRTRGHKTKDHSMQKRHYLYQLISL
jgi:hypothetical protein